MMGFSFYYLLVMDIFWERGELWEHSRTIWNIWCKDGRLPQMEDDLWMYTTYRMSLLLSLKFGNFAKYDEGTSKDLMLFCWSGRLVVALLCNSFVQNTDFFYNFLLYFKLNYKMLSKYYLTLFSTKFTWIRLYSKMSFISGELEKHQEF